MTAVATASTLPHLYQEELYIFRTPVLVVLPRPWENYGDAEKTLLQKILASVNVHLDGVQIVIHPSVDAAALAVFNPMKVLIFGCDMQDDVALYTETAAQGFTLVRADDLTLLDDQRKKNLWLALRQMFGV